MKRFLFACMIVAACRPSDGSARNVPDGDTGALRMPAAPGTSATSASSPEQQAGDSATNALLERADAGRIQGNANAPVWLVEISDFQCPYCKQWHDETYPAIVREFVVTGRVRMAYVNLPLSIHANAAQAAEGAMCASVQKLFWPMHDALFVTQNRWAQLDDPMPVFDSLAVAVKVNASEWRQCMGTRVMRRVISGDKSRAANADVHSTPTFFVGTERIEGAAPIAVFRKAVERAQAKAAGRSPR